MGAKHTPTPWIAVLDGVPEVISANGEEVVCTMDFTGMGDSRLPVDAANAQFIVRAVNAHDDLVGAVAGALAQLNQTMNVPVPGHVAGALVQARELLKSALATAEGKIPEGVG